MSESTAPLAASEQKDHARSKQQRQRAAHLLVDLTVILLAFLLGSINSRVAAPARAAATEAPGRHASFLLPVNSRQLTITLQPLHPSAAIEAQLAGNDSPTLATARRLQDPGGLEQLKAGLEEIYPFSYEVAAPLTIPDECYDFTRQQYDTTEVLDWLETEVQPDSFKTVGLTYCDVYDEGMNFLFGQARIAGPVCVASAARMGQDLKGGKMTPQQRWRHIVRHEFGHTLGLQHVDDQSSVMAYGDSLKQLDGQGSELTAADWKRLKEIHPIRWDN
jgi:archaemetzincin